MALRIDQDVTYTLPVTAYQKLGATPRDTFDQNPKPGQSGVISCSGGACDRLPQEVWETLPVEAAAGQPQLISITEHIHASAHTPLGSGLGWGLGLGLVGAGIGLAVGCAIGQPALGAAAGGLLLGIPFGTRAAMSARGDQVVLKWDQHPIDTHRMTGYQEQVTPGVLDGQSGWFHRFDPQLQTVSLGSYQTPRIEHEKS